MTIQRLTQDQHDQLISLLDHYYDHIDDFDPASDAAKAATRANRANIDPMFGAVSTGQAAEWITALSPVKQAMESEAEWAQQERERTILLS